MRGLRSVLVGLWWPVSTLSVVCTACAGAAAPRAPSAAPAVAPVALMAPDALSYDFQWRQHVTARWPTGTQSFDAVLLKRGGELTMVGLSPLGLPGFVLRLDAGGQLHVENRTGKPLPFEAAYVVADVQRVFFPWLAQPAPGWSGEQKGQRAEQTIAERYEAGRLSERRFERDTAQGREQVVIRYPGFKASAEQPAPPRAELENPLLRYGLVIETLEQEHL